MDSFASGGIGASIVVGLGIAYKIYLAVNHHRIRSTCCGKNLEASIDVEETTPKKPDLKIRVNETGSIAPKGKEVEGDL